MRFKAIEDIYVMLIAGFVVIALFLGCGYLVWRVLLKPKPETVYSVHYYPNGRDVAALDLLASAKDTVYIKTDGIEMSEIATALAFLVQGGVRVILEVPNDTAQKHNDSALLRILTECGITCRIVMDSSEGYRGALIVVDGETTLYSASSLTYAIQFTALHTYSER